MSKVETKKPRVKNCRGSFGKIDMMKDKDQAAYVGRRNPSIPTSILGSDGRYGNPFFLSDAKDDKKRDDVINKYKEWILSDTSKTNALRKDIKRNLVGKDLYCWCAPERCHGDIILDIANSSE